MRMVNQTSIMPNPWVESPPFDWDEEVELDCTEKVPSLLSHDLNCTCDMATDPTCYCCPVSGRCYQLRSRYNVTLSVFEPHRDLYVRGSQYSPFATTMGLATTVEVRG